MSDGTVWQEAGLAVTASTAQRPRLLVLHPAAFSLLRAVEAMQQPSGPLPLVLEQINEGTW